MYVYSTEAYADKIHDLNSQWRYKWSNTRDLLINHDTNHIFNRIFHVTFVIMV